MKKLIIKNFKAYQNETTINFDNKNFLLYGENGAGKSSIYEALKIIFFYDRVASNIESAETEEEQMQFNEDFWNK